MSWAISCYLIVRQVEGHRPTVSGVRKDMPSRNRNESAVKLNLTLPDNLMESLTPEISAVVDRSKFLNEDIKASVSRLSKDDLDDLAVLIIRRQKQLELQDT